jgi:LysM repeat protein
MIRVTLLLALLLSIGLLPSKQANAGIMDSVGVTKINNITMLKYMVSPGETIYGISTKYQVSITQLLEINPELESGLKVGQIINIPYNEAVVNRQKSISTGNAKVHKVESGETLYSLSRKYNISVDQLMKWNNMDLKVGQEIIIGYSDTPVAQAKPSSVPVRKPIEEARPQVVLAKENSEVEPKAVLVAETEKSKIAPVKVETAPEEVESPEKIYPYDPDLKQVLIIPFDPYLYFSDADQEIAAKSKIIPTKVREIFRRRMNALMQMPGYESIFLLGGRFEDTLRDLNKIYSSVSYGYQKSVHTKLSNDLSSEGMQTSTKNRSWLDKQKNKLSNNSQTAQKTAVDKYEGQYFGVKIRNPEEFFAYFSHKYSVDYYIFVNQFEVKTNYENCLDRATHNFERTFTTHFSIFDENGNQIAGNQFKTFYNSNSSYIYSIVADNMDKIATRIMSELPPLR